MQVRVLTLRYSDGLQGFPEEALRAAIAGHEVLEVREHFFVHGAVPHLALVLLLGNGAGAPRASQNRSEENPELQLAEALRPLYRSLREWRNEEAKKVGIPSYSILRNVQLAEICRRLPRSLAALREIEGVGEATCTRYGAAILALLPTEAPEAPPTPPPQPSPTFGGGSVGARSALNEGAGVAGEERSS
ncbi:HRDC domain-containing protein [Accumulibacter sp.]|uniref:HRDC domain-containing protein n=1 Tax=Accumulibacter sp. TaxID=2053492 RepID=UPI0025FF4DAC|nr:HRDC domain-containing protein [Accumulibacter sp.]MCM8626290.1 HRDC domain-containing protein [Accumulibacter sp.]